MNTPFDFLGDLLERLHKRSPVAAYCVALLIVAACTLGLAYLNADGSSASHLLSTVGAKT